MQRNAFEWGTNEDHSRRCLRHNVFNHRIVTSRDPTGALIGRDEGDGGGWGKGRESTDSSLKSVV